MDLKQYYNPTAHTLFEKIQLTEKGCLAFLDAMKNQEIFDDFKANLWKNDLNFFFDEDGNPKPEKLYDLACQFFGFHIYKNIYLEWSEEDIDDRRSRYREECIKFLRELGYFHEEDIKKYTRLLGAFVMGGQYTIRNCIGEILRQKKTPGV